jgi:hypothetical protein
VVADLLVPVLSAAPRASAAGPDRSPR